MTDVDVIVVGAGVNGLTAANYLAKAGRNVVVLERREVAGGIASGIGPENAGLLLPRVASDFGVELEPLDPTIAHVSGLTLWRDVAKSADAIRKLSTKDAGAYPRFDALVTKLADFLRPVLSSPAPIPEIESGGDLVELLKLGWGFRQLGTRVMHELLRVVPMSLSDFLDEWFENDILKATLASPALESLCLGPRSAGTAALFLYQRLGHPARAPKLVEGLVARLGGKLRTSARVSHIRVEDGRARGVVLENGETIDANIVLSCLAPRTTFLELVDPFELPASFVSEVRAIRYRGVTAKLNLVLSAPLELACGDAATFVVSECLDDYERAYDASKYGEMSSEPTLSCFREGTELRVTAQYFPYGVGTRETIEKRILDALARVAPGLGETIVNKELWTPSDYENELGLPEGNWHQGEMALDQMFFMRPVPGWSRHVTPIEGLYLGGASTHPGGGITGACGRNAALRILER